MYQFSQKQKIIIGIIIAIIAGSICYYVYAKEEKTEQFTETEASLEEKEFTEEETYSDTRIFVHITGAVNQEGVVELKVNSRILDAIQAARRNKRRSIYR